MRQNLAGVGRVFLSGGEPLMRKDFGDIVDMYHPHHILAVPTNATHGLQHARNIAGKIAFANIGLEGPRATTNRVRGDYDQVMSGVFALKEAGIPLSLSAVVYRSTLNALPFTCQIADVLNAGKVKLIMPLRKGNALDLDEHEFITDDEAAETFNRLSELRTVHQWSPALRMTTWTPQNEGHMIVIEPTGIARAWPVYDAEDLWESLGNVLHEPITAIWRRYRFKENHYANTWAARSVRPATLARGRDAGAVEPLMARHPLRGGQAAVRADDAPADRNGGAVRRHRRGHSPRVSRRGVRVHAPHQGDHRRTEHPALWVPTPPGLSTAARVEWIAEQTAELGLTLG
jgi:organic radical activating enzyme